MTIPEHLLRLLERPESWEWLRFLYMLGGLVALIGLGELLRRLAGWPAEVTRKFVHISVGTLVFFAPQLFVHALIPITLAVIFIAVNAAAIHFGVLVGIHGTSRFSYGTVYYPLSFLVLIVLFWYHYPPFLSLSMLSLAYGDAAAAIVGESLSAPHVYNLTVDKKSIEGSATMFLTTFIALASGMWILDIHLLHGMTRALIAAAAAAFVSTAWEALSSKGLDNLTVPMSTAFVLYYFFVPAPMQDVGRFLQGIGLGVAIAVVSYRVGFLRASGSVATFLLASFIYGLGGWQWTVPILTFFVLSSLLSNAGRVRKREFEGMFEKTGARDFAQVAANGGVAALVLLSQYVFGGWDLFPMYLGAVAAVTADTWGTEIGIFVRGRTITLPAFRRVEPGANGGISLAGFVGGILGSAVVAMSALPWISSWRVVEAAAIGGVIGALADSLLGATVQASYRCTVCSKQTERRSHCGQASEFVSGFRWMNNDAVNWMCALAGACSAMLILR
jgi:uncharacterized protein (TIGR00297 family)